MRVENGVLIERESREFQPHFWLKIWRKFWFWRGKTGRVWCPEKWWFLLRLWFGILFCWRDEKLCYSRVNSEWRAVQCYTNHVQCNERSCSDLCRAFTLKLRQFPWLFTGYLIGCAMINPLSVVLLSDHSMASSRIIVMKNKIDRITIPQKLGKQSTSSKWHTHTVYKFTCIFTNACVFISGIFTFPKNVSINYNKTHLESYFFIVKWFYCHKNIIPGFLYICKKHLFI